MTSTSTVAILSPSQATFTQVPLEDLRTAMFACMGEDFTDASVEDMTAAARNRLSELGPQPVFGNDMSATAFEASMLAELLTMLTGRADGAAVLH